ncbi:MAG: ThiF family adenylyltransferase [Patescibacteria group bacterium]|nr:ThiF family adenylyltransferase [Patescibacteria group bacterium]
MGFLKDNTDRESWKAVKINPEKNVKKQILVAGGNSHFNVIDRYLEQLEEIFLLRHPQCRFNPNYQNDRIQLLNKHLNGKAAAAKGSWFYFPWQNTLAHFLPEKLHLELRTGRNRNLVTKEEQARFYNSTIGYLGMSVGSHVALTVALTGGAKHVKLADPDSISGSNLNRIRSGFLSVGLKKTVAVARQLAEMNPYGKIEIFSEGINDKNIESFFSGPALDLIIEETDNPYIKIKSRFISKKLKLPVLMAADNGDNAIVDVERYDLYKNLPILHGILGNITAEEFKQIPPTELPKIIAKMAGANFSTVRMLQSVSEVGKTLYSWPQLGTAATLCGTVLAGLARKIITGKKIKSGRYNVNIDAIICPASKQELEQRDKILNKIFT